MFWRRLQAFIGWSTGRRTFHSDERLRLSLQLMSEHERCSEDEIITRLLDQALAEHKAVEDAWDIWQHLTPREQDVAANVCLEYTNRQVAARLGISAETVKTHVSKILSKCRLRSRGELREFFAGWDFSAWDS